MATDNGFFLVLEVDLSLSLIGLIGQDLRLFVQGFLSVSFLIRLKLCPFFEDFKEFFCCCYSKIPLQNKQTYQ